MKILGHFLLVSVWLYKDKGTARVLVLLLPGYNYISDTNKCSYKLVSIFWRTRVNKDSRPFSCSYIMAVRTCGCRYYDTANAYGVHNLSGATRPTSCSAKCAEFAWPDLARPKLSFASAIEWAQVWRIRQQTQKTAAFCLLGFSNSTLPNPRCCRQTPRVSFSSFLQPKTSRLANALLVKAHLEWSIEILELCLSFYGKKLLWSKYGS